MKVEDIINDESVMKFSEHLFDMDLVTGSEEGENAINELIIEKLKTNHMKGICYHDTGYLCEHRKEYFIRALKTKVGIII